MYPKPIIQRIDISQYISFNYLCKEKEQLNSNHIIKF